MTGAEFDLYLARIGHSGPCAPSFETLAAIHAAHVSAIPFENLDALLGRPVRLDAASLHAKLVMGRRGGWCYEHNLLLADVLRHIGFEVRDLAARVMWGVPPGVLRPRTHMLLAVTAGTQTWLADAGFGGLTLDAPLRFEESSPQSTRLGRFRLQPVHETRQLETEVAGEWRPLYAFDLQRQQRVDFELTSWYLGHHPESHFLHHLMAARVAPEGRHALMDTRLSFYALEGEVQLTRLETADEVRRTLTDIFGIELTGLAGLAGLDSRLDTLVSAARSPTTD